jgi:hypothetical protein
VRILIASHSMACYVIVMMKKSEQLVIRLEPELMELADEVTASASKAAGAEMPRASVLRTALRRGLELMRDELRAKAKRSR